MNAPETFGKYILLKKIGRGGMAELFLARQVGVAGFERVLAIKRILPHLTEDAEFVQMFINEAKIAAQIAHPNVVQIYDFGTVNGTYYIAMEYVMGKSLAAALSAGNARGRPMPAHQAIQITARIAAGLDHAHRGKTMSGQPLGIIHRDISPQNILLGYHGDVKLVDFGIAKAASSSTHTQTGMIKGKLAYLSPEQAWGKPVDHRADVFSLGIVLHEMLTGQRLFKADNEIATLERVRTAAVAPPSTLNPRIAKELDPIVLKALTARPDDRYPTAQAFHEALEGYLARLGPPPTSRDLENYLHLLFEKDLQADSADFKQATTITKRDATATTAAPGAKTPTPAPVQQEIRPRARGRVAAAVAAGVLLAAGGSAWWYLQSRTDQATPPAGSVEPVALSTPAAAPPQDPGPPAASSVEATPAETPAPAASVAASTGSDTTTIERTPQRPDRSRIRTAKPSQPAPTPRKIGPATPTAARVAIKEVKKPSVAAPVIERPRPVEEAMPVAPPPPVVAVQAPPAPVQPQRPSAAPLLSPTPEHEEAPLPLLP